MKTNQITGTDVLSVAKGLDIELLNEQVEKVLNLFDRESEDDPSANWYLVVEKIIYDIIDEVID